MRHPNLDPSDRFHRSGKFLFSALSALVLALLLSPGAAAQDTAPPPPADVQQPTPDGNNVRAVRLSDVEGRVQVFSGSQQDFDQAQLNMPVMEGMRLVTGGDGRVEVQFEDGSVARVTPNSSITLSQLHRNADGGTVTEIDATGGLSYYELNGRSGEYSVRFASETATPADSTIFRVNLDQSPELAVMHGSAHVTDGQNLTVDVHTNQTLHFDGQNADQYDVAQSVAADSWDQWNSDRDQALSVLEEGATEARASSGNPDDPAWSDLDYYGDWYDVPGYGQAWAPSGVGPGWDPFGAGAWGYYSGVGYTWISAYSWGWWPYHCGAWNYFNTFGWMWFPGNCGWGSVGAGWYPYATVWRTPPGYRLPVRPLPPGRGGLPPHGRLPRPEPMIAVNRSSDAVQQFRAVGQPKPAARTFEYGGQQIHPEVASVHVRETGPLGESFTSSAVRSNPQIFGSMPDRSGGLTQGNNSRNAYQPSQRGYTPSYNPSRPASGSRPSEAPHYSAPPAAAPAAHPSGGSSGGHPH